MAVADAALGVVLILVQVIAVAFISLQLRHQVALKKKRPIPEPPRSSSKSHMHSTIPSFNKQYQGKLWSKINRSQKKTLLAGEDELYDNADQSEADVLSPLDSDHEDPKPAAKDIREGTYLLNVSADASSDDPKRDDHLMLPIYQRCMNIQRVHCLFWVAITLYSLVPGQNHVFAPTDQPPSTYLVLASLLMGVGALMDGVVVFLCFDNVGRQAIANAERFGCVWGLLNCGVCLGVSAFSESQLKQNAHVFSHLWDPLFIRCVLMLLFSLLAAIYLLCTCRHRTTSTKTGLVRQTATQDVSGENPELLADYDVLIQKAAQEELHRKAELGDKIETLLEMISMLEEQDPSPERDETLGALVNQLTELQIKTQEGTPINTWVNGDGKHAKNPDEARPSAESPLSPTVLAIPPPSPAQSSFSTSSSYSGSFGPGDSMLGGGGYGAIEQTSRPEEQVLSRASWQKLAFFNLVSSAVLCLLYMADFLLDTPGPNSWGAAILCAWVLRFCGYTPCLYATLVDDSKFWQASWLGALSSLVNPLTSGGEDGQDQTSVVIDFSSIETRVVLGRGGFSTVYRGLLYQEHKVAIKILQYEQMTKELVERFLQEVRIFVRFRHPNLVHFIGASISPPQFAIVMELCKPYSLSDMLRRHSLDVARRRAREHAEAQEHVQEESLERQRRAHHGVPAITMDNTTHHAQGHSRARPKRKKFPKLFSIKRALEIATGIADGMRYMHLMKVIHRDLKSSNVLLDLHDAPKICDFGLSREEVKLDNSFAGTIAYMSPEMIRSETITAASDVYSFAIIFWELLTSQLAWTTNPGGKHNGEGAGRPRSIPPLVIMERVAYRKARPPIRPEDNMHPILKVLLRECWADDYRCRPSFDEIVQRLQSFARSQHFQRFHQQVQVSGNADALTQTLDQPSTIFAAIEVATTTTNSNDSRQTPKDTVSPSNNTEGIIKA